MCVIAESLALYIQNWATSDMNMYTKRMAGPWNCIVFLLFYCFLTMSLGATSYPSPTWASHNPRAVSVGSLSAMFHAGQASVDLSCVRQYRFVKAQLLNRPGHKTFLATREPGEVNMVITHPWRGARREGDHDQSPFINHFTNRKPLGFEHQGIDKITNPLKSFILCWKCKDW